MTAVIEVPAPGRTLGRGKGRARFALGLLLTAVLLALVLPSIAGVAWVGLWRTLTGVPVVVLGGLVLLWAAGLALHTITLTAALPGLSARRAATLSLTGSSVSNTLPLGGAAGIALNVRMGYAWGFDGQSMSRYTVVTNICDVLAKVSLPILVLPVLLAAGTGAREMLVVGPLAAAGALFLGGACAVVTSRRGATWLGRGADRVVAARRGRRTAVPAGSTSWELRLADLRDSVVELLRRRWPRLTLGMVLYTASLLALMQCCLLATGTVVPPLILLAAFVLERLLTLASVTPGGAGVVEIALTALLSASGAAAGAAAAGIVLYRILTVGLEVPVGGAWLVLWLSARSPRPWRRGEVAPCVSST